MSQGSLWPHSHFSSYWQSYFPPPPGALGWPVLAAAAPTEARQGRGWSPVPAHPDKTAEAISMPCCCPTGTSHPWCSQKLGEKHSPQEFEEKKTEGCKAHANLVIQCKLCRAAPLPSGRSRHLPVTPLRSWFAFREWTSTPSAGPSYLLSEPSQKPSKKSRSTVKVTLGCF